MTEKYRYEYWEESDTAYDTKIKYGQYFLIIGKKECVDLLNIQDNRIKELENENKKLKFQNGELLYLIGEIGKNNKTCRECKCFIYRE